MVQSDTGAQRIVSLAPSNTEILYALGLGDWIAAVTSYCDFPPEATAKPKVGTWIKIDDALIAEFQPDLVVTSSVVQGGAEERYRAQGLPIVHFDPTNLEMVYSSIVQLGTLAGVAARAEALAAEMRREIDAVAAAQADVPKLRVYIEEWHKPPMMSGNWVPDIVRAAGGEYGILEAGQYSRAVALDEVQAYDPEIIILSLCGLALRAKTEFVYTRADWQEISAVRRRQVYVIDDSYLNRPGPRLVEGVRLLAKIFAEAGQPAGTRAAGHESEAEHGG